MIAQGHCGNIINMVSQAGRRDESLVLAYCLTTAKIISMAGSADLDLIKHGINVSAIAPGVVNGEHWNQADSMFAKLEGKALVQMKTEFAEAVLQGVSRYLQT